MSEDLNFAYPDEVIRFVARFDRGEYWLAHEELEELWLRQGDDASKGLIHLAAALVHLERGNRRGAAKKLESGLNYLRRSPAKVHGLDLEAISDAMELLLEGLSSLPIAAGRRREAEGLMGFLREHGFQLAPWFAGIVGEDVVGTSELPYRVRRYGEGYRIGTKR